MVSSIIFQSNIRIPCCSAFGLHRCDITGSLHLRPIVGFRPQQSQVPLWSAALPCSATRRARGVLLSGEFPAWRQLRFFLRGSLQRLATTDYLVLIFGHVPVSSRQAIQHADVEEDCEHHDKAPGLPPTWAWTFRDLYPERSTWKSDSRL